MATRITKITNDLINFNDINYWMDIGTGNGIVVKDLKWNTPNTNKYCTDKNKGSNVLDSTWTNIDVKDIKKVLSKQKMDLITMYDVIEHFEKEEGLKYLDNILKRTKHAIIFTPVGFYQQDLITNPRECSINPYMEHKSGWEVADFMEMGFTVAVSERFHYHPYHKKYYDAMLAYK